MVTQFDKEQALEGLDIIAFSCQQCNLHKSKGDFAVFGSGDYNADVMMIGEAPGKSESETGIPFVGQAGQLLAKMLHYCFDLTRDEVYIANIVKCRPPNNRDPEPDEIAACMGYLKQQIEIVKPKVIVTLGRVATQSLLDSEERIGKLRGKRFEYQGIPVIPSWHPSYLLRRPQARLDTVKDMKIVQTILDNSPL